MLVLRGGALLGLGAAAYFTGIVAIADYWSQSVSEADRERAVRLLPASGLMHIRLAELRNEPVSELERAAELEPVNAIYWQRLGSQAELGGDPVLAEKALRTAAERSHVYQPRYLLAQFYFRR